MVVRSWRHINERYNLIGTRCKTCGTVYFPSRNVCPKCRRKGDIEQYKLSGKGKIYTYSIIHTPPKDFEKLAPYVIAIIELDEGPKLTAQVDCDIDKVQIGMPVEVAFRRIKEDGKDGVINYGYKFRPVEEL
ncbi:Zn-ribbon domain-containing OB-fold protein [Methanothermococcus sp. Ax23]|uniref:Zn-ribbon domain-containing OB-fold protein n=1 Tax=Methanothermococcus sp. Ax23 TaxID=3156486 RepID=UPI003B9E61AA